MYEDVMWPEEYRVGERDVEPFGRFSVLRVGDMLYPKASNLCARYPASGGVTAFIEVAPWPGRFYTVRAGELVIETGAGPGIAEFCHRMALRLALGEEIDKVEFAAQEAEGMADVTFLPPE